MGFDNFLNTVRVLVQQKLGDSCEVRPEKVLKNNGTVCEGLTIISGSCPIAPTIYLNDFYEMYNCGMPIHRIADQVVQAVTAAPELPADTAERFCDYDRIRNRLAIRLVNAEGNRELLKDLVWCPVLDLAMVFFSVLRSDCGELYSCTVRKEHLEIWNISREILCRDAMASAPKVLPARLRTMSDTLQLPTDEILPVPPLFVLTNGTGIQGASAMLYPDVLKKLADAVDDDLIIIPSSIHEVLLLPERLAGTSRSLNEMVQEVNRQGVEPMDRLSDHVYYFRREGCLITVPQGSCLTTESTIKIPSAIAPAI